MRGDAGQGIPISLTALNDSTNFALALKNADPTNSRAFQVLRSNNNVLLQVDASGVIVSPDGGAANAQVVNVSLAQTLTNKTLTSPHMTGPVVDSGDVVITAGDLRTRRLRSVQGTTLVTADFTLSAGWGAGASATPVANSRDTAGSFTITGSSTPAANPTVMLTFKDGAFPSSPIALCQLTGGTGVGQNLPIGLATTPTTATWTMYFTPVNGTTYSFTYVVVGLS